MEQRFSVDCAINPRTGKERELAAPRADRAKRVVVIGGGPAGLEAARVAAERGHRVRLFERSGQLGGALRWASVLHPENQPFLRYLRDEVKSSTTKVLLRPRCFGRGRRRASTRRGDSGHRRTCRCAGDSGR